MNQEKTSELLDKSAELLRKSGWSKRHYRVATFLQPGYCYCAIGAMLELVGVPMDERGVRNQRVVRGIRYLTEAADLFLLPEGIKTERELSLKNKDPINEFTVVTRINDEFLSDKEGLLLWFKRAADAARKAGD